MSISQRALILIRLDARRGEDVSVAALAEHIGLSLEVVALRLEELWGEGYVQPLRESPGPHSLGQIVAARLAPRGEVLTTNTLIEG
jgi:hypothetical protein